jgi:hypothetical protein
LRRNAIDLGLLNILENHGDVFIRDVFFAGSMAVFRAYQLFIGGTEGFPVNEFLHCTGVDERDRTIVDVIRRYTSSREDFTRRGRIFLPTIFGRFLERVNHSDMVGDMSGADIAAYVQQYCDFMANPHPLDYIKSLAGHLPRVVELFVLTGFANIFRWCMYLSINDTSGGNKLREFWRHVTGATDIADQVIACRIIERQKIALRSYFGALIHCTSQRLPQEHHFLNRDTYTQFMPVIRRDIFDIAFSFLGRYTDETSLGVKYCALYTPGVWQAFYQENPALCHFPPYFIANEKAFIPHATAFPARDELRQPPPTWVTFDPMGIMLGDMRRGFRNILHFFVNVEFNHLTGEMRVDTTRFAHQAMVVIDRAINSIRNRRPRGRGRGGRRLRSQFLSSMDKLTDLLWALEISLN